ncbi:Rossmann-like and DUF2520 domain-containing protein [Algivirga pacifica]|uniref:DUF2520 domain-containing protein n=1 Tax=Algivirga pacifica TaxID=1162670 RepID=A0ABP9D2M8_9BACT
MSRFFEKLQDQLSDYLYQLTTNIIEKPLKKVVLIGAGNVAWHMAPALEEQGFSIEKVYSRSVENAEKLCEQLYDAVPIASLDFRESEAQLFIIAVSDTAIEKIARQLQLPSQDTIVVHTSGAMGTESLKEVEGAYGVLYPLQTFSKSKKVDFKKIPICIDASTQEALDQVAEVAYALSKQVYHLSSEERRKLHVAAVLSCNFTNHFLRLAKGIMEVNGMHFEMLEPLIRETIDKAFTIGPENAQTGPAVRGDVETMNKHLLELSGDEKIQDLYKLISENIMEMKN